MFLSIKYKFGPEDTESEYEHDICFQLVTKYQHVEKYICIWQKNNLKKKNFFSTHSAEKKE